MSIQLHSGVFILQRSVFVRATREKAWDFLSDPSNLQKITPSSMNFQIAFTSGQKETMYPGQIICYKVRPFPFIRTNWVTEITHVNEGSYFVDEQRFGPYKFWHHQHMVIPGDNGTFLEDIVSFKIPFGPIGRFLGSRLIKYKLNQIFDFREKYLMEFFNK